MSDLKSSRREWAPTSTSTSTSTSQSDSDSLSNTNSSLIGLPPLSFNRRSADEVQCVLWIKDSMLYCLSVSIFLIRCNILL
jgi:hypothetical protein